MKGSFSFGVVKEEQYKVSRAVQSGSTKCHGWCEKEYIQKEQYIKFVLKKDFFGTCSAHGPGTSELVMRMRF